MDAWSSVPGEKLPEHEAGDQPLSSAEEEHAELYLYCFYTQLWRGSQTVGKFYTFSLFYYYLFILLIQRALLNTADPGCVYLYWRLLLKYVIRCS